jgi:TRAP-type mannitol/chloroaromatic compound transport system permease small subunit
MQALKVLEYSEVEVFQKIIIFIASYKSLQNNGHVKKEIIVEGIIHEIKKDITCILI